MSNPLAALSSYSGESPDVTNQQKTKQEQVSQQSPQRLSQQQQQQQQQQQYQQQNIPNNKNTSNGSTTTNQTVSHDNIPQPPQEPCPQEMQQRINDLIQKRKQGHRLNAQLKKRRDFKNPAILKIIVDQLGIDEFGSNYSKDVWDPHGFSENEFYDKLGRKDKTISDQISFRSGGVEQLEERRAGLQQRENNQ